MATSLKKTLRHLGFLTPRTEQELMDFEASAKKHFPSVPDSLSDPWSFKKRSNKPFRLPQSKMSETKHAEFRAMAARNGSGLSPEILAKMKKNSSQAKRDEQ